MLRPVRYCADRSALGLPTVPLRREAHKDGRVAPPPLLILPSFVILYSFFKLLSNQRYYPYRTNSAPCTISVQHHHRPFRKPLCLSVTLFITILFPITMRYPNTSGSALVASKEQQDDAMTDVSSYTLPHRQIQAHTSTQSQRSSQFQQSIQGEDESFWWKRLDILTTIAANAPHLEDAGKREPSQPTHARVNALRPQAQRIGAQPSNGL